MNIWNLRISRTNGQVFVMKRATGTMINDISDVLL